MKFKASRPARNSKIRRSARRGNDRRARPDYSVLEARRMLANDVLPDMFAWASQSRGYLYDYVVEGNLLRFSTALANMGPGNFELRGGTVLANGNQEVYQRIYQDDGTFRDRLAGEFTYHAGHGHIHFDGYAIYNLRENVAGVPGDIVATGGKVSFCLIDIAKYDSGAGNSLYHSCGQVQGVTAGWSDVYGRGLPDQWINITGVPDGDYFLEVVVDPYDQLLEADETNNTTTIPVTLNTGGAGSGGDRYEPNNTVVTSTNLGMTSKFSYGGMSIHSASDVDYYQITSPATDEMEAEIQFTHSLGNLDLFIYDSAQNLIASSATTEDGELAAWDAEEGETYFVKVIGVSGDTNGYELYIHGHSDVVTYVQYSSDVPVSIPDNGRTSNPALSTLPGPNLQIQDVNLLIDQLDHTYLGDLRIELISPSGTVAKVLSSNFESGGGPLGSQDNFFHTTFDDQAPTNLVNGTAPYSGSFHVTHSNVPANALSLFNGENALGEWTLRVSDWAGADVGTIRSWGIAFTGIDLNPGDAFEQNDAIPQATYLGVAGQLEATGATIHRTNDEDFYRFIAGVSGEASIDLSFVHADGNLDFRVYDEELNVVAIANSDDDNEHVTLAVDEGGLYYIEVFSAEGTNSYDLSVDLIPTVGESGSIETLTTDWQTVTLPRTYADPVVIISPLTRNDLDPAVVQIRNVTSTSFEVRMKEWEYQDGVHAPESVKYLVLEAGRHVLPDGSIIVAGKTQADGDATTVSLAGLIDPQSAVLAQVMTQQNSVAVMSNVVYQARPNQFDLRLREEEAGTVVLSEETVGWVALSRGNNASGMTRFEVGGISLLSRGLNFTYTTPFQFVPNVFAGAISQYQADPFVVRLKSSLNNAGSLVMQEDKSFDQETVHPKESMVWVAFESGPIFSNSTTSFGSQFRESPLGLSYAAWGSGSVEWFERSEVPSAECFHDPLQGGQAHAEEFLVGKSQTRERDRHFAELGGQPWDAVIPSGDVDRGAAETKVLERMMDELTISL